MRLFDRFAMGPLRDPVSAIGAGIGGIGSIIGGILGSNASSSAANIQSGNAQQVADLIRQALAQGQGGVTSGTQGANSLLASGEAGASQALGGGLAGSTATLADIFQQEMQNVNPYLQAGQQGITGLENAVAPGGALANQFTAPTEAQVEATPGYQFTLDQGVRAITNNAAARGLTGGTLKDITQFGQGNAQTYYQNAYNNALNTFGTNRNATMGNLSALLGLGTYGTGQFQTAAQNAGNQIAGNQFNAGQLQAGYLNNSAQQQANNLVQSNEFNASLGMQGTGQIGNALTAGANAQAAGTVGSANAWSNAIGGVTNAAQYATFANMLGQGGAPGAAAPGNFTSYASAPPYVPYTPPPIFQTPSYLQGVTPAPAWNQSGVY